jgi:arsenate reductase
MARIIARPNVIVKYTDGGRYEAFSGGGQPSQINPFLIETMQEIGIDLSAHRVKSVNEFKGH